MNWPHSGLALGGPTNSAPSVRSRRSSAPLKTDSAPNEPRLSPNTTSFGRRPAGTASQRAYTWSDGSRLAARTRSRSATNELTLGRYEYCSATLAVSPAYMYSSGTSERTSTSAVPVVVITHSTCRENAPVRSSSRTARAAWSRKVGADCSPTYARIGCSAGWPANPRSCSTLGALDTNSRPHRPRDVHDTSDRGLPDSSGADGAAAPPSVCPLSQCQPAFVAAISPLATTPCRIATNNAHTATNPTTRAATAGIQRPRYRPAARALARSPRASPTSGAKITTVASGTPRSPNSAGGRWP